MPHHEEIALTGIIRHVFAHRFTLESKGDLWLADLGPKGAEQFALTPELEVALKGELRPSEIKVTEIAAKGGENVVVHHKKPHHHGHHHDHGPHEHGPGRHGPRGPHRHGPHGHGPHGHGPHGRGPHGHGPHAHLEADPALAARAAKAAGWTPKGEPVRKPKHFEVLARQGSGPWAELHVDLDGGLYKVKALPDDGGKWAELIG